MVKKYCECEECGATVLEKDLNEFRTTHSLWDEIKGMITNTKVSKWKVSRICDACVGVKK